MKRIAAIFFLLILSLPCFAETIVLKSGKTVEGKLLEKTDKYIKIDFYGVALTYFIDEIESIDGNKQSNIKVESYPKESVERYYPDESSNEFSIRVLLKDLSYPENSWSNIEKEFDTLLAKIDFERFKKEIVYVKSDARKLQNFLIDLGKLLEQKGYLGKENEEIHQLRQLLIKSLGDEDILVVIDNSQLTFREKNEIKNNILMCGTISQMVYILLDLLGLEVKVATSPDHIFNCVFLDSKPVLFVDFTRGLVEIVDLEEYYKKEAEYFVLKEEQKIPSESLLSLEKQIKISWPPGATTKETINLYWYIQINERGAATPSIYNNIGYIYYSLGKMDRAFYYFNKAIQINPYEALPYSNLGLVYYAKKDSDLAINKFSKAIQLNSHYDKAYANRGLVYYVKGNIDQAVQDFNKATQVNPNSAETYINRGFLYMNQRNFDLAIHDFDRAIHINPNLPEPYYNRAIVYSLKQEYSRAWEDVHKAESLGKRFEPKFLEELRKSSGR